MMTGKLEKQISKDGGIIIGTVLDFDDDLISLNTNFERWWCYNWNTT